MKLNDTTLTTSLFLAPIQYGEIQSANDKIASAKSLLSQLPQGDEAPLVLNSTDRAQLPRHFRESVNPLIIPTTKNSPTEEEMPNCTGLNTLHASASAQPTEGEFQALASHYLGNVNRVTVVNLREESILFINGHAISKFAASNLGNMGKSLEKIVEEEEALIDSIRNQEVVTINKIISKTSLDTLNEREPVVLTIDKLATEQEIVSRVGLGYLRIPMTDHMRPNDRAVDAFVSAMRQREDNSQIHFHCWEGHGRTTTVMIMLDAMQNADKVSFNDICKRQWWLGGEGSNMSNVPTKPNYKHELFDERFQFLSTFYHYCQENRENNFQKSWTQYLGDHGIDSF